MESWRVGFHQEGKTYQQDVFLWCKYSKETEAS